MSEQYTPAKTPGRFGEFLACMCVFHLSSCSGMANDSGVEIEEQICVLDPCVASASGEADGVACCLGAHGMGLTDDAAATLARSCNGDECDASQYLTEAAAVCAAQVCGLTEGISGCSGSFQFGSGGGLWSVSNNDEACEPEANMCGGGEYINVDARTGACGDGGSWKN